MYKDILETDKPRGKVTKALWKDIRNVSRSGNAIARLVHTKHARRWSEALDAELIEAFAHADALATSGYRLGTQKDRKNILQAVALKTSRSPAAVQIRLTALGIDLSRKKEVAPADIKKFITSNVKKHFAAGGPTESV